ncbi:hypothetical protein M3223_19360 [Paenibacillus pasadenensis]|uniref:hypothetical protein n=1 Tax=Paenibacillus pasadenensis TaxID=217090 RepID=UPI00203FF568|nr:hypothetical protein [Paenibacillus pasadenensis]MCM3749515.1 hypothetical protein [Paenibacillus pasadenensis]
MMIELSNATGKVKKVKVGFSWTTLIFGFFPALFRRDWKWAGVIFILIVLASTPTAGTGWVFVHAVFAFIYNKIYITNLLKSGYYPVDSQSKTILEEKGMLAA